MCTRPSLSIQVTGLISRSQSEPDLNRPFYGGPDCPKIPHVDVVKRSFSHHFFADPDFKIQSTVFHTMPDASYMPFADFVEQTVCPICSVPREEHDAQHQEWEWELVYKQSVRSLRPNPNSLDRYPAQSSDKLTHASETITHISETMSIDSPAASPTF